MIRHAKAETFIEGTEDHNRKLVNNGIQRASNLASWLSKKTPIIQELHFSSSIRTIHTAEIISRVLPEALMKFEDSKLYSATEEVLLNYLSFIDDKIDIYTDNTFVVSNVKITYIRVPDTVDSITATNVDCDLPDHTHQEIVDMTVNSLLEAISDPRYRTNLGEVQRSE